MQTAQQQTVRSIVAAAFLLVAVAALALWGVSGCSSSPVATDTAQLDVPIDPFGYDQGEGTLAKAVAAAMTEGSTDLDNIVVVDSAQIDAADQTREDLADTLAPVVANDEAVTAAVPVKPSILGLTLEDERVAVVVPRGAVSAPVIIDIVAEKRIADNGSELYEYTCGPHGLVFERPIRLIQEVPFSDGETVGLYYLNENTNEWQLEAETTVSNGLVGFKVYHFSKYGIGR